MPFIIETIVTSLDADGHPNCAPMGVEWGEELVLRPFQDTQTYRNLVSTRQAVINLTDNVELFARAAISDPIFPARPAVVVRGVVLEDVCSWREVEVVDLDAQAPRARLRCRVVHAGFRREFLGYNRAQAAVLEAAILATRTHLIPLDEILREYERLWTIVRKTGGTREHEAMQLLAAYVEAKAKTDVPSGHGR